MQTAGVLLLCCVCWFGNVLADEEQFHTYTALAKFHLIEPVESSLMPMLKIKQEEEGDRYKVRLSNVPPGQYYVSYGDDMNCGAESQTSQPLMMFPLTKGENREVELTVPSLDQLRDQPALLLRRAEPGVMALPFACGKFTVIQSPR